MYIDGKVKELEENRNSDYLVRIVDKYVIVEYRKGVLFVKFKYLIIEKEVGVMNLVIFDESKYVEDLFENNMCFFSEF